MVELDENIRYDVEEYRKAIYRDIERRYPTFNKITPMPRIFRCHHSLDARRRIKDQSSNSPSLIKGRSTHLLHHSYQTTNFSDHVSPQTVYRKDPKVILSCHEGEKENTNCTLKRNMNKIIKDNLNQTLKENMSQTFKEKL